MEVIEITPDVFVVGGSMLSGYEDAAVYLIKDGDTSALIDAGTGEYTDVILQHIEECGISPSNIAYIFVTHCHFDHTGGINGLRDKTNALVAAHAKDAVFITSGDMDVTGASWYGGFFAPTPVDIIVTENKREFPLEKLTVTMHHTPGHSPGSCVYTVRSDNKLVLFGQDVHGPIGGMILKSDKALYKKSLQFLLSLDADILCEGHFGVIRGKDEISKFISSFL